MIYGGSQRGSIPFPFALSSNLNLRVFRISFQLCKGHCHPLSLSVVFPEEKELAHQVRNPSPCIIIISFQNFSFPTHHVARSQFLFPCAFPSRTLFINSVSMQRYGSSFHVRIFSQSNASFCSPIINSSIPLPVISLVSSPSFATSRSGVSIRSFGQLPFCLCLRSGKSRVADISVPERNGILSKVQLAS